MEEIESAEGISISGSETHVEIARQSDAYHSSKRLWSCVSTTRTEPHRQLGQGSFVTGSLIEIWYSQPSPRIVSKFLSAYIMVKVPTMSW